MELAELPNRRVESWKYSDLRAALADAPLPAVAPAKGGGAIERLAMAQGAFAATVVGAGESRVLVETLSGGALAATAREIRVGKGGSLTRIVVQPSDPGVVLSALRVTLAEAATFRQFVLAEGAKLARVETRVEADGERVAVELGGVYLAAAGRHADLTSTIEHRVANGQARQLIKGAVRKGGRGVFQGRIEVARGAQKTDARQHHQGLMLDEGAEIFAKPELEIYADDVQCAHGNTIGALDEAALFYMRARGIPQAAARAMLTEAFLIEAVPDWLPEAARGEAIDRIRGWLGGAS